MTLPIRVLQVIGIMNRGGAENMIMNLYRNIDRSKIQFDFVEHTETEAAFDSEILSLGGIVFHCPRYQGINHLTYIAWWKGFLQMHADKYIAVHGHIGSTAAIYLSEAKKYGLYTISHSHSAGGIQDIKGVLYWMLSYPTRHIANYFFSCSKTAGITRFGKKVGNSTRCRVLNNAIETGKFAFNIKKRVVVRQELGLREDQLCVGHIGRFDKYKNQSLVIDIFDKILKKVPDAKLLFIGDGPMRNHMEQKAITRGIISNIIFTGVRRDVDCFIMAMDIFVFPSIFEGFPLTLVEVQTSGLPCVISDTISEECILTEDLIEKCSLDCGPEVWADRLIGKSRQPRYSHRQEILKQGYDISTTANWIEGFYLGI